MPKNGSEFKKQEEEKEKQERRRQLTLKVYEKGVEPRDSTRKFISRIFKAIEDEEAKEEEAGIRLDGPHTTPSENEKPFKWGYYHIGTISDFVEKEREICRLEYAISIGKEQIKTLRERIHTEVEEMVSAENCYNDEAFEKYVEEEERKTLLALTRAEEHKKALKVIDIMIQKTKNELGKMRREIAKCQQNMKLNQQHEDFLLKLSPLEFQKEQENRREITEQMKAAERKRKRDRTKRNRHGHGFSTGSQNSHSRTPSLKHSKPKERTSPQDEMTMMGNLVAYERPQIYFNNPHQLINIMTDTENDINNMAQEMSLLNVSLEDDKEAESNLMKCIKTENSQMIQEVQLLAKEIKKHAARKEELQNDIDDFSKQEKNKEQEEALTEMDKKVREVYSSCIGFPGGIQTTADVLRRIDAYLYDLMEKFNQLPEKEFSTIKRQYRKDVIARAKMKAEQERQKALEERRQRRAEKKRQQALAEVTVSAGKKAGKPSGRSSPKK